MFFFSFLGKVSYLLRFNGLKPILKSAETISIKIENQKKKSDMKTRKLSVLVLGFLASVFALTSCDMDSDNYNVQRPTAHGLHSLKVLYNLLRSIAVHLVPIV